MSAPPRVRRTSQPHPPTRRLPESSPSSDQTAFAPIPQARDLAAFIPNDTQIELKAPLFAKPGELDVDESMTTMRTVPERAREREREPQPEPEVGTDPRRGPSLETGDRVGKYTIGRKLGQGTFGIVFEALDTNLDRSVALKVLSPAHAINATIVRRFLQEGRAAARVSHPGIVTVLDCGEDQGTAYILMELLQGESLANRLARSGALSTHDAMEIGRQVAAALHAAHEMGVVHRDLKPDNIYLVPDPAAASGERAKVLDFGLAKLRQAVGSGDHTQTNQAFGTPRYMAPEQARSAGDVDRRADIYALGCILFELVCGRSPFEGEMLELFDQHQRKQAPRAQMFATAIPHGLDLLIAKMLEKPPTSRPATMAIVQAELQAAGALAPGVAATVMPMASPIAGLTRPGMPLVSLHGKPSVVMTPLHDPPPGGPAPMNVPAAMATVNPMHHAPIFGPGPGMIPVPQTPAEGLPVYAMPLPVIPARPAAPRRRRRIGLYLFGAAVLVTAAALLTTIALRSSEPAAGTRPAPAGTHAAP